jgi:hypothetical protein
MGRDEKRSFKPNKKHFWLANTPAIKEQRNGSPTEQRNLKRVKDGAEDNKNA